ncbi:MAG: hypothetical protein K0R17_1130 [Rariglobus sp.]|jgi:predicted SAM-dependent methyltransferase|nr:hypothetical protein [Rariglobus sp.]
MILTLLKATPVIGPALIRARARYRRVRGSHELKNALLKSEARKRIVLGAAGVCDTDWIPSDIEYLDMLKQSDWDRFFTPGSIDAMLAEHVWEHLTSDQGAIAAANCFKYLRPGGYLRVAVPDGLHPSPIYREWVRVGGSGPGADDHKILHTYRTFSALFEQAGFQCKLLEYFDENGNFHECEWSLADGRIVRSKHLDERNHNGALNYTSIILDASKS